MAHRTLRRLTSGVLPLVGMVAFLLVTLDLMSNATSNSAAFSELYAVLILVVGLGLLVLLILIGINLWSLLTQLKQRVAGSRLTARMVLTFALLALTPVSVVYYFSLQFLHRGIDSWFDVRVERALDASLELSRTALDLRMRELHRQSELMARELAGFPNELLPLRLNDLREPSGATELTVLSTQGRILAASAADASRILPDQPDESVLLQARQSGSYIGLDPLRDAGLHVRVLVRIPDLDGLGDGRLLHALFPISERMSVLADGVQSAYAQYQELSYLRTPLKQSFTLTLSMVLLVSLLSAVWAAFVSARRITAPIQDLAEGTRAVAQGDYETQLPASGSDELGFLVQSFNDMTRRLSSARDTARRSQREVEEQRTYLEAVLARMSSGVITLDDGHRLYTSNQAAHDILGVDLDVFRGQDLGRIGARNPYLESLTDAFTEHLSNSREWREEASLFGPRGRQVLMCRGTPLTALGEHVIVFDDVTALVQAQRDAAWGEVARRLAHEIKNPLTPIQLSAERLRHKYLPKMQGKDHETMDRLTHTIVQQVETMKEMVNAFSNYARSPQMRSERTDLSNLVREVLELYRYHNAQTILIEADLGAELPLMDADPGRLRQVVHNLVKNAIESAVSDQPLHVRVSTRCVNGPTCSYVELAVEDDGRGFAAEVLEHMFEPYVTTKTKGTGLGLAIVKKIVEEHGGMAQAENRPEGGARVQLRFPAPPTTGTPRGDVEKAP